MLKPLFQSYVEAEYDENNGKTLKIGKETPASYKIKYYSAIPPYTLVGWEEGAGEEPLHGETLWRGNTPIAKDAGELRLIPEPPPRTIQGMLQQSPWGAICPDLSAYGLDALTGQKLRESILRFIPKQNAGNNPPRPR